MNNMLDLLMNIFNNLSIVTNEENNIQQLDFTKKEDIDKLDKAIDSLINNDFLKNLININLLKDIQSQAHKKFEESEAKKKAEEEKKKVPERPSLLVPEKIKNNITNYACEYMNTMILPYANLTQNQVQDILSGLVDFGCWIYNR